MVCAEWRGDGFWGGMKGNYVALNGDRLWEDNAYEPNMRGRL